MSTTITITDTGSWRTDSSSVDETSPANNGDPIVLYGVEVDYIEGSLLNTSPSVGMLSDPNDGGSKFATGRVDHIGVKKPKWTVRGVIDSSSDEQLALFKVLRDLNRTKSYKVLSGDLPDFANGVRDNSAVNVRISEVKLISRANTNIIDYTITMYEEE